MVKWQKRGEEIRWFDWPFRILFSGFMWPNRDKGMKALPEHLRYRSHGDYIFPLNNIMRWATAFDWGPPRIVLGNQTRMVDSKRFGKIISPIGWWGEWQISVYDRLGWKKWLPTRMYWAVTTKRGLHIRCIPFGSRFDSADDYTQSPAPAIRSVQDGLERDWQHEYGPRPYFL